MRIASFDVGICNLAYCVMDIDSSTTPTKIHIVDWNVSDVSSSPEKQPIPIENIPCGCFVGTGKRTKPCPKFAQWKTPTAATAATKWFCARHAKIETAAATTSPWMFPDKRFSESALSKRKMDEIDAEYAKCSSDPNACETKQTDKLKKADKIARIVEFYRNKCLVDMTSDQKVKKTAAKDISLVDIGRAIRRLFETGVFAGVTHVLIENQISTIASRMKTIQGLIAQAFLMSNAEVEIEFISSHNKLKGYWIEDGGDGGKIKATNNGSMAKSKNKSKSKSKNKLEKEKENENESDEPPTEREAYKTRKREGILITEQFILANHTTIFSEKWQQRFGEKTKRDDLADSFLQLIWWLRFSPIALSNKLIVVADDLKINSV